MYLDNFPTDLDEYFVSLSKYFNVEMSFLDHRPWYFKNGIKLFTTLHPDPAVKRYSNADWKDIKNLYKFQLDRSSLASEELGQESHFDCVFGKTKNSRKYSQQPCSVKSINNRVEMISKSIKKEEPILIIGDDDALSIALMNKGFTDVTVFEIDERIVKRLSSYKNDKMNKFTIVQQDVFEPVAKEYHRPYSLITFDPWYAIDGLKAFTECALGSCLSSDSKIVLSFNCGALQSEYHQFNSYLDLKNLKVSSWIPLANTYPIPNSLSRTLYLAECLESLLSFKKVKGSNKSARSFFSSDLLLLTKKM